MNTKYVLYGLIALGVLIAFYIHPKIGVFALIILGLIWGAVVRWRDRYR